MIADKIHEALSYIDDDMIEVVEQLREADVEKKKRFKQLHNFNLKMVVAVAVICLVATVAFTVGPAIMIFVRSETEEYGSAREAPGENGGNTPGSVWTADSDTEIVSGNNVILVKITKLQTNGFAAKVVNDYGQRDIYGDGEQLRGGTEVLNIVYSDEIEFVEDIEPAVGSVVKIEYSKMKTGKIVAYRVMSEYYDEE